MKKLFYLLAATLIGAMVMFSTGCSDDDDDASDSIQDQITGKWFKLFSEPIIGPNDATCNALFFDFEEGGDFTILSFLDGEQVAGHIGTYSFDADTLIIDITHDWQNYDDLQEPIFDWVEAPYSTPIYTDQSSDGDVMLVGPSEEEAWEIFRVEMTDPDDGFIANWGIDSEAFLDIVSPADFEYYEPEGCSQSGTLEQFTYTDDKIYFLVNITNCTCEAQGACDYYFCMGAELNEAQDQLNISFGEETMTFTEVTE